jgi:hypothetical protein
MKISKRSKITSSKETADRKTDRRISPTNVRYKGYMIRLDRGGDGYNVYDTHGELEDAGYASIEKAKEFVDELENEAKGSYVRSSIDEYDIFSSEDLEKDANSDDALWEVIDDDEFEFRGVQDVSYDDDGSILVVFNNSIRKDMVEPTAEDLLAAFRKYGYSVNEWDTNGSNVFILSGGSILSSTTNASTYDDIDEELLDILDELSDMGYDIHDEADIKMGLGAGLGYDKQDQKLIMKDLRKRKIIASYNESGIYEETEDPKWICLDIKHVRDSDGMLTDYALYTTKDEDKYICMFGDADVYAPDEMYADAEFDTEDEALEWFENYVGPGDKEDEDDIYSSEETDAEEDDDLDHPDQEYDSAATSINSTKLPAIYRMIKLQPGTVGVDFGGGKFDNAVEYLRDQDVTLCVYDPYNRSAEHNREVLRTLRANGGADFAINSNVLNVIKEPEARKGVLENIKKITKPGAPIYITVYEGRGDAKEGVTKSGYQLNRKTADYLEEIQEVFPDAKRKGKLIVATNKGSVNSSSSIKSSSEIIWDDLDWNQQIQLMKKYISKYKGTRIFEDFAEYIDMPVEDIIDDFCDAEYREYIVIPERMQLDSEYRNDDIYSSSSVGANTDEYSRVDASSRTVNSSTNIKSSSEIIWDDLDWNQQIQVMKRYIRNYKGTRIFEDFADYINKPVEDIIDSFTDAESHGDIRIPERKQIDSEYRNDDIYSSTTSSSRYWYFTRHGVQPGSVPKYVNILDIVDKPEGSYFLADGVILTKDLRDYDIKERKPEDSVTSSTLIKSKGNTNEYSDILEEIREQCNTKLIHIMAQYGFDESEAKQYSRVDASIDDQYGRIEIGCELDYDGLMRVCQELDPIVQAYDPDSYFEPVDPGIAEAYVNLEKVSIDSSSNIQAGAYDFPEPSLDPPEYPEPEEGEETVEVECDINQLEITVEEDGSWEYQRDDFLDEMLTAENEITSEEYDVYIRDRNGLIEDFDSIVEPNIPGVPGTYLISCHVKMVYDVTGVEIVREHQGKDEDGDPIVDEDYYTGSADVEFNRNESYITNFYSEEI